MCQKDMKSVPNMSYVSRSGPSQGDPHEGRSHENRALQEDVGDEVDTVSVNNGGGPSLPYTRLPIVMRRFILLGDFADTKNISRNLDPKMWRFHHRIPSRPEASGGE
jgi:hypothetical protein